MKKQAWKLPFLIISSIYVFVACRGSKAGDTVPENKGVISGADASSSPTPVLQPQAPGAAPKNLKVTLDSAGKLIEVLALRLDYFPPPNISGVSVPSCYQSLAPHLVVGRLLCGANGNKAADVTAGQVIQQCYTVTPMKIIAAVADVALPGCVGAAQLQLIHYVPEAKLEIRP